MIAETRRNAAERDGSRIFAFTVLGVVAGIVLLIVMLAFFGSPADGEPSASVDLASADKSTAARTATFHQSAISLFAAA